MRIFKYHQVLPSIWHLKCIHSDECVLMLYCPDDYFNHFSLYIKGFIWGELTANGLKDDLVRLEAVKYSTLEEAKSAAQELLHKAGFKILDDTLEIYS